MAMIEWDTFFAAQLGASAALAGLLFVGISINMTKILKYPMLVNRALQSLILLGTILVVSSFSLDPDQSVMFLGVEILIVGASVWAMVTTLSIRNLRAVEKQYMWSWIGETLLTQVAVLSYAVAGIVTITLGSDGINLLVPAVVVSFVVVLIDAWVLLVEINR
jgi:hypothetical protein